MKPFINSKPKEIDVPNKCWICDNKNTVSYEWFGKRHKFSCFICGATKKLDPSIKVNFFKPNKDRNEKTRLFKVPS